MVCIIVLVKEEKKSFIIRNIEQCYKFIRTFRGGIENLPISTLLGKAKKAVNTKQLLVDRNPVDNNHQLNALQKLNEYIQNIQNETTIGCRC